MPAASFVRFSLKLHGIPFLSAVVSLVPKEHQNVTINMLEGGPHFLSSMLQNTSGQGTGREGEVREVRDLPRVFRRMKAG